MNKAAALAIVVLGLAGCAGSPPVHYFSLSTVPSAGGSASGSASGSGSARMLVEILPPAVPERLNRQEMVLTTAGGGLDVRDQDHWAAPLADEVRQVVADTIWTELGAADVYQAPVAPTSSSLPQYRLALRIERFDAVPGQSVRVEGAWTFRRLPQGASATCRYRVDLPLPAPTPEAAATALGQATRELAKAVSASLGRMNRHATDPCSQGS